ncbi:hypothetical protein C8Q75DRAFT_576999 [Abortiporus biennis]|nr:hypothetical protein C8Q75DRAFT_576999 [Abortiporus biennis]
MKTNKAFIVLDVALVAFCVYDTLRRKDFEKRRPQRCEEGPRESEKIAKSSAIRESVSQPLGSSQKLNLSSCSTSTIVNVEQQVPTTVDNTSSIVQQEREDVDSVAHPNEDELLHCPPSIDDVEPSSPVRSIYDMDISTLPPLPPSPLLSASNSFKHPERQEDLEMDLSTLPPLPPNPPPSTSPSFEEKSVVDLDLSCLPPLPPSPLLSESTSFEHLEEQAGFELDLSTLPPLPPSPLLSPSPSFEEESTRVNLDLSLDLGAIEEWVVIDLTSEEKEEIVDAKDNVEDVLEEIPAEEESSSLLEDHSCPVLFEEGPTLVQDENASEAKIDIAVQLEVTSVEEFLETVALVPSASLHEFERPAESEMKIPSSTSSPSKLGLYLRSVDFGTSVVTSPAAEIEDSKVASTGAQPEVTKKTPAPRHKRAKRGGKNQRRPGKPSTSNDIASVAGMNTDVATASPPQTRPSGSHKHQSTGPNAKASNRSSTPSTSAPVARPYIHISLPPKPKTACPIHKVTPVQNNGPSAPLSGGVKLGVLTERMNSQEQKTSGPRRGHRSRKPRASN